jgi:hypothetical protein
VLRTYVSFQDLSNSSEHESIVTFNSAKVCEPTVEEGGLTVDVFGNDGTGGVNHGLCSVNSDSMHFVIIFALEIVGVICVPRSKMGFIDGLLVLSGFLLKIQFL